MLRVSVALYVFAEVASLVVAGRLLGVGATLLLVVLALVLGMALLRRQGAEALASLRPAPDGGRDLRPALVRGGFRLVAAALLILPGFVGDVAALLLLTPVVQRAVARRFAGRGIVIAERRACRTPAQEQVLDAEWEDLPPPRRPTHPSSGWTRH